MERARRQARGPGNNDGGARQTPARPAHGKDGAGLPHQYCADKREGGGMRDIVANKAYCVAQRQRRRSAILAAYGNRCVWCGCPFQDFLEVDHINNDGGGRDRKLHGSKFYEVLIRFNKQYGRWPTVLQLLCRNCNGYKGRFKIYPWFYRNYYLLNRP